MLALNLLTTLLLTLSSSSSVLALTAGNDLGARHAHANHAALVRKVISSSDLHNLHVARSAPVLARSNASERRSRKRQSGRCKNGGPPQATPSPSPAAPVNVAPAPSSSPAKSSPPPPPPAAPAPAPAKSSPPAQQPSLAAPPPPPPAPKPSPSPSDLHPLSAPPAPAHTSVAAPPPPPPPPAPSPSTHSAAPPPPPAHTSSTPAAPPPPPPHTSSTPAPPPPPAHTQAPAPPPPPPAAPAPAPAPPSNNGGSGGSSLLTQTFTGDATFYAPGLGACGITNSGSDLIAAAAHGLFDTFPGYTNTANPNSNPICGRSVTASVNGKSVTVKIVDRCAGCDLEGSLDFSPAAFDQLADPSVGRVHGMTWKFD